MLANLCLLCRAVRKYLKTSPYYRELQLRVIMSHLFFIIITRLHVNETLGTANYVNVKRYVIFVEVSAL